MYALVFAKAIQLLSKIGDEMFVQPLQDYLSFRSVNGSNSAFSDVTFQENFFSYYSYENSEESDSVRCKILIRVSHKNFSKTTVLIQNLFIKNQITFSECVGNI